MRRVFAASLFALTAACGGQTAPAGETASEANAALPEGAWRVDYAESRLGFTATQTGKSFDGVFEKYDAEIVFDPSDLSTASIDVAVDMTSATTGDKQRDAALPGSDWFKAKDFPSARFQSSNVEEAGQGAYVAHGSLTIRDATKNVDLPFTLAIDGDKAKANGELMLLRTDYGVGQGEFATDEWVGLEVKVTVEIVATK